MIELVYTNTFTSRYTFVSSIFLYLKWKKSKKERTENASLTHSCTYTKKHTESYNNKKKFIKPTTTKLKWIEFKSMNFFIWSRG